MSKYLIHVNRHTINRNKKNGTNEPDIAVRKGRGGKPTYANSVDILDKDGNVVATIGSHRDKPLSCGATVFITCNYGVALRSADGTALRQGSGGDLPETVASNA